MVKYEYHPAACIFPMLDADELESLGNDIKENGLMCPIELLDGKIIDGRNRYQACLKAGVDPGFVQMTTDDPLAYVLSLNLHRRHLNAAQRAMAASKAKDYYERDAKTRQSLPNSDCGNLPQARKGKARDKAGEAFDVSGSSVDAADKVRKGGTPALVKTVESGNLPVSVAVKLLDQPAAVQNKVAKADNPKKAAKEATTKKLPPAEYQRRKTFNTAAALQNAIDELHNLKRNPKLHKELLTMTQTIMVRLEDWK